MTARLVRGELLKLRTTRTALGFAAALGLLTLAVVLLSILSGHPTSIADKRDALAIGDPASAILLLFGVVGAAAEYRHRTLAPALLVAPGRARLLAARIVAFGAAAVLIGAFILAVAFAIGLPLLANRPGPSLTGSDYLHVVGGGLLSMVLSTILGVGVGTFVGKQVPAVIGTIVWIFVLEPLSNLVDHIAKFSTGQTATAIAGGANGPKVLAFGPAVAVLLAWAAIFVVAAVAVDRRRDIT
jgi:hypothetical protein